MTLESVILVSYNGGDILPTFINAAQIWNHEFFWESMKPGGGGKPGDLLELIDRDFGSFVAFVKEFKSAASTQFGSGWAWLAYKANRHRRKCCESASIIGGQEACSGEESQCREPSCLGLLSAPNTIDVWEVRQHID